MKNIFRVLALLTLGALPLTTSAQTFQEGFESYVALFAGSNPWSIQNRSDSVLGGQPWLNNSGSDIFGAQSGTGYVEANYLSTGGRAGTEHVSNWLLSPTLNLTLGGTVTFYTRSAGAAPDRLEVRLSLNGSSTNVGTTSSDLGDFTTLLLTINPAQLAAGTALAYPTAWTQYTATVTGVPVAGATGRIAFHYDVTNSGINGTNGDYVGVDTLASNLTIVPEPSTYFLCLGGFAMGGWLVAGGGRDRRRPRRSSVGRLEISTERRAMRMWVMAWQAFALVTYAGLAGNCLGQLYFEKTTVTVLPNGTDLLVAEFPFVVGPDSVVIGTVKPDCSCAVGTLDKNLYEPGEKGRIKLEFRVGDYGGPQEKRLLIEASDQPEPHVLTLVTDLPRVADLSPRTVYWDHAAPLTAKVITFEVGAGQLPVTSLRVVSDHPAVTVTVKEIVPGRKFELHLTPAVTTTVLVAKVNLRAIYENKTERAFNCFAMVKPKPE